MQVPAYRRLFEDETVAFYAHQINHFPVNLRFFSRMACYKGLRKLLITLEELLLPGDLLHIISRKWYMNTVLASVLDRGYRQIIVLGAGFDHLALRAAQAGMTAIEIDKPVTISLKKKIIEQYKYNTDNLNLHLESCCGSAQSIIEIIDQNEFITPYEPVLIVTEGFWDYQTEHINSILSQYLSSYFKGEIRLASTVFNLDELTPFHRFIFRNSIRSVGEKLTFQTRKASIEKLFEGSGFSIIDFKRALDLKKRTIPLTKNLHCLKGFNVIQLQR